MKAAFDELPCVSVSRLRASGAVTPAMRTTIVKFDDVEFNVALSLMRFPNGGSWNFFICSCGRRCRVLRLFEGGLICSKCCKSRGLGFRVELIRTEKRAVYHLPRILARLNSATPARLHPRKGQMLDRRANLEARLKRSLIVARRFAIKEFEKWADK